MAVISFADEDAEIVSMRKALFRMIIRRAAQRTSSPEDRQALAEAVAFEGLSFEALPDDRRARLIRLVLAGVNELRAQVEADEPTEETILPGFPDKLAEISALLTRHLGHEE
jgi:hypothetical protein